MKHFSFFLFLVVCISCKFKPEATKPAPEKRGTSELPLVHVSSVKEALMIRDSLISFGVGGYDGFPVEILQNPRVVEITMNFCDVSGIPDSILKLTELRTLIITYSGLKTIPRSLTKLKKLRYVSFLGNELTEIPDWVCEFDTLQMLNFKNNNLRSVPDCVKKKNGKIWLILASDKEGKDLRDW